MIVPTLLAGGLLLFVMLIGLVTFIVSYYKRIYRTRDNVYFEENYQFLFSEEEMKQETEDQKEYVQNKITSSLNLFDSIEFSLAKDLFWTIEIYILIWVFIFIALIALQSWLTPKATFWAFTLSFSFGVLVQTVYYVFAIAIITVKNLPFFSTHSKDLSLNFAYWNGLLLSILLVIENLFCIIILSPILNAIYFKAERNLENYRRMSIAFVGYGFGSLFIGIFFRESLSILGRGIMIASELILKNDSDMMQATENTSQTLKVLSIACSEICNSIVNYLDAKIIISMFCVMPFLTVGYSEEVRENDFFWGTILAAHIILSLNLLGAMVTGMLFSSSDPKEDGASYVARAVRRQIIIQTIISSVFLFVLGQMLVPEEFISIGNDESLPSLSAQFISGSRLAVCSFMGLGVQLLMLIFFETRTSHGYFATVNLSFVAQNAPVLNMVHGYYLGSVWQVVPALAISLLIYTSYSLCGVVGLLCALSGLVMNLLILLPILFIGGAFHDAFRCGQLQEIHPEIVDNMQSVAWAARNYNIHARVVIASCTVIIGILLLLATVMNIQKEIKYLWTSSTFFGVVIGVSLAFFNRGMVVRGIQNIATELVSYIFVFNCQINIERTLESRRGSKEEQEALFNYIDEFIPQLLGESTSVFLKNIASITIVVLTNGLLFGINSAVGQGVVYLLIQVSQIYISLLTGTSLRNAKLFYQKLLSPSQNSMKYASHLYGDSQAIVLEDNLATPSVYYILFNLTLTLVGYEVFANTGWLSR